MVDQNNFNPPNNMYPTTVPYLPQRFTNSDYTSIHPYTTHSPIFHSINTNSNPPINNTQNLTTTFSNTPITQLSTDYPNSNYSDPSCNASSISIHVSKDIEEFISI